MIATGPKLTKAQRRALQKAAERARGNICPTVGVYGEASMQLIYALDRRGFIEWSGDASCPLDGPESWRRGAPYISAAGRAAIGDGQ